MIVGLWNKKSNLRHKAALEIMVCWCAWVEMCIGTFGRRTNLPSTVGTAATLLDLQQTLARLGQDLGGTARQQTEWQERMENREEHWEALRPTLCEHVLKTRAHPTDVVRIPL